MTIPESFQKMQDWKPHIEAWPERDDVGPLCVHAEETVLAQLIILASQRPLHVCHVARRSELELIQKAKEMGLPITVRSTLIQFILNRKGKLNLYYYLLASVRFVLTIYS